MPLFGHISLWITRRRHPIQPLGRGFFFFAVRHGRAFQAHRLRRGWRSRPGDRVYWTLKSSGVSPLAILNGGMNAWEAAKLEVSTAPVTPAPSDITFSFSDKWLATTEDVQAVVAGTDGSELIDARTEAFWEGNAKHDAAARPDTLPQSRYFTHSSWFGEDAPSLIKADTAKDLAAANGFEPGDHLVSFCNTGHWAATNWFALSELAGIEGTRLYPESMVGWSNAGNEMANVPRPVRNLWNKITGKY